MWITKWAYKLGEQYGIDPERIEVARAAWQVDRLENYETALVAIQNQLTATGIPEPPISLRCNNCYEDIAIGWCRCGLHKKPCSDCGGEATSAFQMGTKDWRIGCRGCVRRFKGESKVAVLEMWNGSVPWHKLHVDHGVGPDRTAYTLGRVDDNGNVEIVGSVLEPLDEVKCECGTWLGSYGIRIGPEEYACKDCLLKFRDHLERCFKGEVPEYSYSPEVDRHSIECQCCEPIALGTTLKAVAECWNKKLSHKRGSVDPALSPELWPCKECGERPKTGWVGSSINPFRIWCCRSPIQAKTRQDGYAAWNRRFGRAPEKQRFDGADTRGLKEQERQLEGLAQLKNLGLVNPSAPNPHNLTPCACGKIPRPVACLLSNPREWRWDVECPGCKTSLTSDCDPHCDAVIRRWNKDETDRLLGGLRGMDARRYDIPTHVTLGCAELPEEYRESVCPHCKGARKNGACFCLAA